MFFNLLDGGAFASNAFCLRTLSIIARAEFDQTWAVIVAISSLRPTRFNPCKHL